MKRIADQAPGAKIGRPATLSSILLAYLGDERHVRTAIRAVRRLCPLTCAGRGSGRRGICDRSVSRLGIQCFPKEIL